ncbi:hypothetical protein AS855_20365 [Brucella intermedia M86]|nr:hypothetical protein AS855_20365 [Brucella intermedia M86]
MRALARWIFAEIEKPRCPSARLFRLAFPAKVRSGFASFANNYGFPVFPAPAFRYEACNILNFREAP